MIYSLDHQNYTWKNAIFWGNCLGHCKQASQGSWKNRVVHILIAIAEFFPIIGQIASIFEKIIVTRHQERDLDHLPIANLSNKITSTLTDSNPENKKSKKTPNYRLSLSKICPPPFETSYTS